MSLSRRVSAAGRIGAGFYTIFEQVFLTYFGVVANTACGEYGRAYENIRRFQKKYGDFYILADLNGCDIVDRLHESSSDHLKRSETRDDILKNITEYYASKGKHFDEGIPEFS